MQAVVATENVVKGTVVILNVGERYRTLTVNIMYIREKLLFVTDVIATGKKSRQSNEIIKSKEARLWP